MVYGPPSFSPAASVLSVVEVSPLPSNFAVKAVVLLAMGVHPAPES